MRFDDEDEDGFHDVASIHQVPNRRPFFVEAGGQDVLLYRTDERIVAMSGMCTHAFSSLREARVEGDQIVCARHGARFDLATGRSLSTMCRDLPRYEVRREGVRVLVRRAGD